MKLKFFTLKKSAIVAVIVFVLCCVACSSVFYGISVYANSKYNGITIVLDAGHGGADVKKGQYSF